MEAGEGGQREGGGTTTATERGGSKEGRGKKTGIALARGGSCRIKGLGKKEEAETEAAGGEAGASQWRYKKGHITNIYL